MRSACSAKNFFAKFLVGQTEGANTAERFRTGVGVGIGTASETRG
jgi:hypothetical protein